MGRDHLEDLGVDGKIKSELILWNKDLRVWIECIWFKTGASGGLL
jgi:hypothetical protein